jgi:diguanylate cyclase
MDSNKIPDGDEIPNGDEIQIRPFESFHEAVQSVLKALQEHFRFDLFMLTQTEGEDWTVLEVADSGYGISQGDVFVWSDSFCSRMVQGKGPCIAPDSDDIEAYREAPVGKKLSIRSYIGLPLYKSDGHFFGTLCGIHPSPKDSSILKEKPLLLTMARLLSSLIETEIERIKQMQRANHAEISASHDSLTGIYNRKGWEEVLINEGKRCIENKISAGIIYLDVDGLKKENDTLGHSAGDALLQRVAHVLESNLRNGDICSRIGGDEFVVLSLNTNESDLANISLRLQSVFKDNDICVSVGFEMFDVNYSFEETMIKADKKMYENKKLRKSEKELRKSESEASLI